MNKPELKPCPFCGSDNIVVEKETEWCSGDSWAIGCDGNNCMMEVFAHHFESEKLAIEIWNTREIIE